MVHAGSSRRGLRPGIKLGKQLYNAVKMMS